MTPPAPSNVPRRRDPSDGSPTVFVVDEQAARPVDTDRWGALAERVLASEGVQGEAELSLLFVDRVAMTALNHDHLGGDGATDVLSFPIDGDLALGDRRPDAGGVGADPEPAGAGRLPLLLGDVVICPEVAAVNAPTHAGTYDDELALLVVHGILHLLGMDHAEDDERTAMQAHERDLLGRLHGEPARDPWAS